MVNFFIYFSLAMGTVFGWDFYSRNTEKFKDYFIISALCVFLMSCLTWPYLIPKKIYEEIIKLKSKRHANTSENPNP